MSKETKHHRSENGPQGPPSVDTSAMVGTPSNALYKSVPNRIPEVEIISSNCSKPSPLSSTGRRKRGPRYQHLPHLGVVLPHLRFPRSSAVRLRAKSVQTFSSASPFQF